MNGTCHRVKVGRGEAEIHFHAVARAIHSRRERLPGAAGHLSLDCRRQASRGSEPAIYECLASNLLSSSHAYVSAGCCISVGLML